MNDPARTAPAHTPLGLSAKLFYGFGSVAYGVKNNGFNGLLLVFYNQVVGLPAWLVSTAIMIALVADAALDPIVGQVSDNWRSPWGRRHPFMYASAVPVALSYLLLWTPPHWSRGALFAYLIVVAIVIRTFITFYEIPSSALAAELSADYDERTSLLSYRLFFGWWGGLSLNLAAFAIFLRPDRAHPVGQLNPAGYGHYGLAAAITMFAAILISAAGTHRYIPSFRAPPRRRMRLGAMAREMASTLAHRSFLMLTASSLFTAMAVGLTAALGVYFNTYFWQFSAGQIAALTAAVFISAAIALFASAPLSRRFGKKPAAMALIVGSVLVSTAPPLLRLAGLFPPNGAPILLPLMFAQTVLASTLGIAGATLTSAMIADVVEDSELRTGRRSEGLFFSAASFVQKAISGVGIFSAGMVLLAVRFPATARPGHVEPQIVRNLAVVYLPTLWALYGLALAFLAGYRITRASHMENLERLAAEAEEVAQPVG
ncbi:MAG TPA: MFS transporter [Caulobacteraceae bacterium]|jgi:Na+/melibiose symporter-like transporter|nr:MFS transporter [Caulobacteraceae bacterium]